MSAFKLTAILFLPFSQAYCADVHIKNGGAFFESTYLIELTQDTNASLKARELRVGGFETSGCIY